MMELLNLNAATIPLTGKHLIEASAGTGKTYNITRIYLRLLLERELTVEQILLMTFTKDATQELRGRIDTFIREALTNWQSLCEQDDYFKAIDERVDANKREFMLKRALLFLDEASIFTIHGFCQRALSQHAFSSGLSFNANMSTDSSLLALEACQDWYRQLAKQGDDKFNLVAQFWPHPNSFISTFGKAISHDSELTVNDLNLILKNITLLAQQSLTSIDNSLDMLKEQLVSHKKAEETEKRAQELKLLRNWLEGVTNCDNDNDNESNTVNEAALRLSLKTPLPDYLLHGNRHPKAFKTQIAEVLLPCKTLKKQLETLVKDIDKAKAYKVVKQAILKIRQQVIDKKLLSNTLDFDDLIKTLSECVQPNLSVHDTNQGVSEHSTQKSSQPMSETSSQTELAKALLAQYPVALIDEFQDTDPKQFSILKGIYYAQSSQTKLTEIDLVGDSKKLSSALYLIGDPKQAIYGFRGGDVFAYLSARKGCDHHWLMDTNWRSSPSMINAYNQVFSGESIANDEVVDGDDIDGTAELSQLDDKVFGYSIPYQSVKAGKRGQSSFAEIDSQLTLDNRSKALNFIHFEPSEKKTAQSQRPLIANWCANEISLLLNNDQSVEVIRPKDIAILVRDGAEGQAIKQALLDANLPSVFLSDRANLFESEQAQQIILLLKGIISPENERHFLAAITCGLLGFDLHKLYALQQDEIAFQKLHFAFTDYRSQWQSKGFISMAIGIMHRHFKLPSLNKDRILTNVLHLFELLQMASQRFLHPQELLYWFEQQCNPTLNSGEVEAELRLENDGDLIRIVTQHGAKGLEYPVVFIPFATRHRDPLKFGNKHVTYIEYHDEKNDLILSLDGDKHAKKGMADEAYAETIRLLYVAITRAEKKCYIFTTPFDYYALSPLGKTLKWHTEEDIVTSLNKLVALAPNDISVDVVQLDEIDDCVSSQTAQPIRANSEAITYQVSKFNANIERDWWLSSFTALSKRLRHDGKSSPDRDSDIDNSQNSILTNLSSNVDKLNAVPLLRFKIAKGAHTGNFLHSVLEHADFTKANWQQQMNLALVKFGQLTTGFTPENLVDWLEEIVHCDLSPSNMATSNDFCLAQLAPTKMLREVEFYFPMVDASSSQLTKLLTDHRKSFVKSDASTPTTKIRAVRLPAYTSLKGMMHGFIDLVFEHQGKYYVCDYKSSHLGDNFDDYNEGALNENIESNHYDLQYLIYSLALHRYLKSSLKDYNPESHFGGAYYLYLRGMKNGADNNLNKAQNGVYFRDIDAQTLESFDALFAGGTKINEQVKQSSDGESYDG